VILHGFYRVTKETTRNKDDTKEGSRLAGDVCEICSIYRMGSFKETKKDEVYKIDQ
jgi:hypothetical protein